MRIQRIRIVVVFTPIFAAFRDSVINKLGWFIVFRSDSGRRAFELIEQIHAPENAPDLRVIHNGLVNDHQNPGSLVNLNLELVTFDSRVELLFISFPISPPLPNLPPDPQGVEQQVEQLVRGVQDGLFPPPPGGGDDRFREAVSRYLSHIEGYIKAMKAIRSKPFETPPLLPNVDSFYPSRLHFERPGFQKAVDVWRQLGDPERERQRTPPHALVNDSLLQRELLKDQNFGRIIRALERFYNDELHRLGR